MHSHCLIANAIKHFFFWILLCVILLSSARDRLMAAKAILPFSTFKVMYINFTSNSNPEDNAQYAKYKN